MRFNFPLKHGRSEYYFIPLSEAQFRAFAFTAGCNAASCQLSITRVSGFEHTPLRLTTYAISERIVNQIKSQILINCSIAMFCLTYSFENPRIPGYIQEQTIVISLDFLLLSKTISLGIPMVLSRIINRV